MKFILSLFLISFTFAASANNNAVKEATQTTAAELIYSINKVDDRRKTSSRRNKRINKKRKRRCHQFSKSIYAG